MKHRISSNFNQETPKKRAEKHKDDKRENMNQKTQASPGEEAVRQPVAEKPVPSTGKAEVTEGVSILFFLFFAFITERWLVALCWSQWPSTCYHHTTLI